VNIKAVFFVVFLAIAQIALSTDVPVSEQGERKIVVVAASYNNKDYYQKHLDSIFMQQYENYHVIYVDDCSTDGTYDLVKQYIEFKGMNDKVTLIGNKERCGSLANQYKAVHMCANTDLIILLDGDDWLLDELVFSYLNDIYRDSNLWLTYGNWQDSVNHKRSWLVDMPKNVVESNGFRDFTHAPGHLRVFYAGLFKKIKIEDLMHDGDFFQMTGDIAAMFPMIEMAHKGHFRYVSKILMVYNSHNPINDHKLSASLQFDIDKIIRQRDKYDAVETPF
jgi:Glycosyltransferases involved in cell wall biogenesis